VGTYKSAVEPFIRNDMSPEARQNYQALDEARLETWRQSVKQARPKANVDLFLQNMNGAVTAAGGDMARAALTNGLVDKIGDRGAFERRLEALGGKRNGKFRAIGLGAYVSDAVDDRSSGPIGVVTVSGLIVDGKGSGSNAGGDRIAKQIEEGVRNGIKALVVRVDSPGGSVLASERIRQALLSAKAENIPIVVSMGSVAASGGYWVATPANFIYAEPSTITGSIGVFGIQFDVQKLANNFGITFDSVKTGKFADALTISRPKTPEELAVFQRMVDWIYTEFVRKVAESRKLDVAVVQEIAQGRVWSGVEAQKIGLVDELGGLDAAIAFAAQKAGLGANYRLIEYPRQRELIEAIQELIEKNAPGFAKSGSLAAKIARQLESEVKLLKTFNDPQGIYARLPMNLSIH
ncbi:MAG TPA: signal peptide peptidase SppA, partial [Opitutaceae bacterium]|nr:signal peptide peptidase SppA [Opitutaceae bacterium]